MHRYRARTRAAAVAAVLLFAAACDNPHEPDRPAAVASVEIGQAPATVPVGSSQQLTAVVRGADGRVLGGRTVTWASSDTTVAAVSPSGLMSARSAGPATITARSEGRSGSASITVTGGPTPPGPVDTIGLDVVRATIEEGEELQITATPRDAAGIPIPGLGIQWSTSDESVAQVAWGGRVTAIRTGTATITVRVHGKVATATVDVTAAYPYDLLFSSALPGSPVADLFRLDLRGADGQPRRLLPDGTAVYMARPSADGSRIVFSGGVNGEAGIFVVNPDGSGVRGIVTSVPGLITELTLSPDGRRVAFHWKRPGEQWGQIWSANVDGDPDLVSLTADLGDARVRMPAWSPAYADGTSRIAYVHQVNGIVARIWTMRPDGSDKRQITTGDVYDEHPAWSPDGETIVFERVGTGSTLRLVRSAGGGERHLVGGLGVGRRLSPAWSPDGRLIAFTLESAAGSGGTIYTVWSDGSKLARRTRDDARSQNPAWIVRR